MVRSSTLIVVPALVIGVWGLHAGRGFFIPLVFAILAFALVNALDHLWEKFGVGRHRPSGRVATVLSALAIGAVILVLVRVVVDNASAVAAVVPSYRPRIDELRETAQSFLSRLRIEVPNAEEGGDRLLALAEDALEGLAGIAANALLVLVYLFFLLLERPFFERKLRMVFREDSRYESARATVRRMGRDVSTYVGLKTVVSIATAVPSYVIMRAVGLDFAAFWAIGIFVLNYIPNIGSMIATVLPTTLALVQFPTLAPVLIIGVGVTTIQLIVANVLEPQLMARSLNMSPLVVTVSLVGWTLLWGVAGAFLCVPLTGVILLVLSRIEGARWIAVLCSRDGDLRTEDLPATS